MKEIKAYIKPHLLSKVTLALHKIKGLSGATIVDARGFGRDRAKNAKHRIVEDLVDYAPRSRIEIICKDSLVKKIIFVIEKKAHTGLVGDGKIIVTDVVEAVRISTGERGDKAI